jgi:hypothetical protein
MTNAVQSSEQIPGCFAQPGLPHYGLVDIGAYEFSPDTIFIDGFGF